MLILTRKIGEKIMIGDDIVIELTGVEGRQARLGIQAPDHIAIDREEIRIRKDAEQADEEG